METKTYTTIDRAALGWPSGEWDNEPDKVQWPDADTGFPCLAKRHPRFGFWCGYVGVTEGHPAFGKQCDDVEVDADVELTFSAACRPGESEAEGICHVPGAGESDSVWWLGFDCGHYQDLSPRNVKDAVELGYPYTLDPEQKYRTLDFVKGECRKLAAELAAMTCPK